MNKTVEIIKSRVSCRSYSDKKVPKGKIEAILEAGKFAPSGMNRQICNILYIKSKATLEKIRTALHDKFKRECLYGAKTLILVIGPIDDPFTKLDGSCIIENMFIAATALKVDSCWINQLEELLRDPTYITLRKKLGLKEEDQVVGSLILGYRDEKAKMAIKPRKEDFIRVI